MELDAARLVVLAGDPGDVVARFPGVVCVARSPEPDLLRQLLRLCADAAGPDPGRTLARSLARWLAGADDLPDRIEFGTVSTAGDQLAVFLSGATAVEIDSSVLSGTDAAAWTDRLLTAPDGPVRLALQDGSDRRSGLVPELLDLRDGVVPGAGAELVPGGAVAAPRPAEQAAGAGELEEEPVGRSPLAPDPVPPQRPPGNGVGPPIELDKVADPAKAQPVGSPAPLPVPQVPEQPDEPGADEEFTSGEWFGAAAEADQRTASPGADDSSAEPSAPSSGQAGRHAVHGLGEATEQASGLGAPDRPSAGDELPTPREGDALVAATVAAVPDAHGGEPIGHTGSSTSEREQPVPAQRPAPSGQPATASVVSRNGQQVQGRECPAGHLNDPRSQFCVQCNARIDGRAALVSGVRPALGLLVFDDGASYTVDADYLVGRLPESDQRVSDGGLRCIVVEDRSGAVSRVHAEIRVDGWDVLLVDSGSRNGTFVADASQQGWTPLAPGRSRRLVPGTRVRMGGRTFVFEPLAGTA